MDIITYLARITAVSEMLVSPDYNFNENTDTDLKSRLRAIVEEGYKT